MIFKLLAAALGVWIGWKFLYGQRRRAKPAPRPAAEPEWTDADIAAARRLLGVDAEAGESEIRAAHRRLIRAVHPDHGGSAELSRQINAARDMLLVRTSH